MVDPGRIDLLLVASRGDACRTRRPEDPEGASPLETKIGICTRLWMCALLAAFMVLLGVTAGCGSRSGLRLPDDGSHPSTRDASPELDAPAPVDPREERCGSSGFCTTTTAPFAATFGGLEEADRICQSEYPGSHFYRASCDADRPWRPATSRWPRGYGAIEQGECWSCMGWTTPSGPYSPDTVDCPTGYATVAALVPSPPDGPAWRTCEAGDWPLTCCLP